MPCVTIRGFAKGVGYQPGQKMDAGNFGASWNAVLIDKYWRLIDVHWGARFITGTGYSIIFSIIAISTHFAFTLYCR